MTLDDLELLKRYACRNKKSCTDKGGATILKVGVQVFDPPPLVYLERHKTGYYSFHYCNYDV